MADTKAKSRKKQKFGGAFMAFIGALFTGFNWYTGLSFGYYYVKTGMIFPAVFVIGLGLIFFPGYKEERIAAGEDISRLQGIKLITPRWWAILAIALIAGGANLLLHSIISRSGG